MNANQYKISNITELGNLATHHLLNFAVLFGLGLVIVICATLAMRTAGWNRLAVRLGSLFVTGIVMTTVLWMNYKLLTV